MFTPYLGTPTQLLHVVSVVASVLHSAEGTVRIMVVRCRPVAEVVSLICCQQSMLISRLTPVSSKSALRPDSAVCYSAAGAIKVALHWLPCADVLSSPAAAAAASVFLFVQAYADHFRDKNGQVYTTHGSYPPVKGAPVLVPTTDVIERNRPKSPPR